MRNVRVLLGLLFGFCFAASVFAQSATYYACVTKDGALTMVSADFVCKGNSTKIQWNAQGPQGERGPAGPPGGMQWIDANGTFVGPFYFQGVIPAGVWNSPYGRIAFRVFPSGNGYGSLVGVSIFFTTTDCSGDAYTQSGSFTGALPDNPRMGLQPVGGSLLVVRIRSDLPQLSVDLWSQLSSTGQCTTRTSAFTQGVYPVEFVATAPFTLPFSLQ